MPPQSDLVYFGDAASNELSLAIKYPKISFHRLRQVHGNGLILANENTRMDFRRFHPDQATVTGDALWTTQKNQALVISTADCLPILIRHPNFLCAIHAGWRGVANEIIPKSLSHISQQLSISNLAQAIAHIGPHIGPNHFEVGKELLPIFEGLAARYFLSKEEIIFPHPHSPDTKALIHLGVIAVEQLKLSGINSDSIEISQIDTFTDPDFHSYRRGRGVCGRNLSFVARPEK